MSLSFAPIVAPGTQMTLETPSFKLPNPADRASKCRFAAEPLRWIRVGSGVAFQSFARSAAAVYTKPAADTHGNPADAAGPWTILELSPLPAFAPAVFRGLGGGMPVQYILLSQDTAPSGIDQNAFGAGDVICTSAADAWFGIAFQDRIVRDPAAWSAQIGAAITQASADAPDWAAFAAALAAVCPPTVYLLDHVGRPLSSGAIAIDVGNGPQNVTIDGRDGDSGVLLPPGARASISFTSAVSPLVAGAEVPGAAFELPYQLASGERHAQLFDADSWFAPKMPGVSVPRWRPNSHVEGIPDGTPYFMRLVPDLRAARNGGAAYFAGWAFTKGSVLDPTKPWDMIPWQDDTQVIPLFKDLVANNCQLRFLSNQLIMLEVDPLDDDNFAFELIAVLYMALIGIQGIGKLATDPAGFGVLAGGLGLVTTALSSTWSTDLLRTYAEPSFDTFPDLAALGAGVAAWARYPPTVSDNPLAQGPLVLPGGIVLDDVIRFGVFHQKGVAIRFPGGTFTSYLGGVDINSNRADTPIHRATFPYHDVHAQVDGPAAQDVIVTLDERLPIAGLTSAFTPPGSGGVADIPAVDPGSGQHLAQIARTYFVPKSGSGTVPFPFAPRGDTTIHDTILRAINHAADFIYIEDQYFTPDDEYVDALIAAANRDISALIVLVSLDNGQPFGDIRLTALEQALRTAWGPRFRMGTPYRRYLNPTPAASANLGRCLLREGISEAQNRITIGPISRTPAPPFWVFIEGELMMCTSQVGPDDVPNDGRTFWVERGPAGQDPRWGANMGKHDENSPALCVRVPSIYVHAKCMMIDDVFMTVGSANVNRRGHFHDGELNVFAVPQRLKNDPTNPARLLRCRLWGEHLGLTPEMALSLLSDPLSAIPFFDRSWYVGSPFQPLAWMGTGITDVNFGTSLVKTALGITEISHMPVLWPTAVDPTTTSDPHATDPGPALP